MPGDSLAGIVMGRPLKVPVADVTSSKVSTVSMYTSTGSASPKPLALKAVVLPGVPDVNDKVTVAAAAEVAYIRAITTADPRPTMR